MLYFFMRYDMISLEMFGSDIIRVKITGYLKNNTDNEIIIFNENGIKNKNKISFLNDNVKYNITNNDNEVILKRVGNDFINYFKFSINRGICNYLLKDNNYDVDIDIKTNIIDVNDNVIYVKYIIIDSDTQYEFKIEINEL